MKKTLAQGQENEQSVSTRENAPAGEKSQRFAPIKENQIKVIPNLFDTIFAIAR